MKEQVSSREHIQREKDNVSKEQSPSQDDETYSTDSNSTADDDIRRKKRNKLFSFTNRKPRTKMS